jgi:hypothetical protein
MVSPAEKVSLKGGHKCLSDPRNRKPPTIFQIMSINRFRKLERKEFNLTVTCWVGECGVSSWRSIGVFPRNFPAKRNKPVLFRTATPLLAMISFVFSLVHAVRAVISPFNSRRCGEMQPPAVFAGVFPPFPSLHSWCLDAHIRTWPWNHSLNRKHH